MTDKTEAVAKVMTEADARNYYIVIPIATETGQRLLVSRIRRQIPGISFLVFLDSESIREVLVAQGPEST